MGTSEETSDQRQNDQTRMIHAQEGRFPELTLVQRAFPNPFPSAGDITPCSEWTSSSTASSIGWSNGEVPSNGEAAVLAMANGFELSKTVVGVGRGKVVMAAVE